MDLGELSNRGTSNAPEQRFLHTVQLMQMMTEEGFKIKNPLSNEKANFCWKLMCTSSGADEIKWCVNLFFAETASNCRKELVYIRAMIELERDKVCACTNLAMSVPNDHTNDVYGVEPAEMNNVS